MNGNLEQIVRLSLWATAPFNLVAAYSFSFPQSALGQLLGLPQSSHPFYTLFSGALVGLFGLVYIWLTLQTKIHRPTLFIGASGKFIAVAVSVVLFAQDILSSTLTMIISGDLLFAGLWFYYIYRSDD